MAHGSNEVISIGWCDNGTTDGKFTEGLVYTTLMAGSKKIPVGNAIRVQGNQIGRQRQEAFDFWYKETEYEWILWIDSDIVVTDEALKKVWEAADKYQRPVVAGTYFISKQNEDRKSTR